MLVNSSVISSVDYNPINKSLEVSFNSGSRYEYAEVPRDLFISMSIAPSVGKFFNEEIKNSYSFNRIA